MEAEEKKNQGKKTSEKKVEALPFCTNAPSAEHSRGTSEEEPCDDGREGR